MDFDKFTERARSAMQAMQTLALRNNHQFLQSEHLLKVLLDDDSGVVKNLIRAAGGRVDGVLADTEEALAKLPSVEGNSSGIHMSPALAKTLDQALQIAQKAGDKFVTLERLLQAEGQFERPFQPYDLGQFAFDGDPNLVAGACLGKHPDHGNPADAQYVGDFVLGLLLDEIHPGGADAQPVGLAFGHRNNAVGRRPPFDRCAPVWLRFSCHAVPLPDSVDFKRAGNISY